MLSKTHIPVPVGHPKHPKVIVCVPLLCGRAWEVNTKVTYSADHITCGRCKILHSKFQQDQLAKIPIDRAALQDQLVVDG